MTSIFQGRSLLAEKDFTRKELEFLINFSLHLKDLKKEVFLIIIWKEKTLRYYLKKIRQEHALLLQQHRLI
ncbi:hypothetical protein GCM10025857_47670 [Alicyclobacillus contaminans]|nr:hypothetical protein GCM10025857_47670 [Alicyclobacillus contaminans]